MIYTTFLPVDINLLHFNCTKMVYNGLNEQNKDLI